MFNNFRPFYFSEKVFCSIGESRYLHIVMLLRGDVKYKKIRN